MNQDAPPLPTLQQQAMQFLNRITDLPRVRHLLAKLIPVSLCLPDLDAQSFGHRFGGVTFGQSIEIGLAHDLKHNEQSLAQHAFVCRPIVLQHLLQFILGERWTITQ